MDAVVKIILALAVVAFIGYPLLKNQLGEDDEPALSDEAEDLYRRKESIYSAIKELEFDYKTGKLSEQDFRDLDARFKAEAIEILEAIDEAERPRPKAKAKKTRIAASTPRAASQAPAAASARTAAGAACLACGRVNPAGARFCGSCGEPIDARDDAPEESRVDIPGGIECETCGAEVESGHRFCGSCGMQVQA